MVGLCGETMIDCQRDLIDAEVECGCGSAVRNRGAGPRDRASWTAVLQAEMDAAIATHRSVRCPGSAAVANNSAFGATLHSQVETAFRSADPR